MENIPSTAIARRLKASSTVRIGDAVNVQLTPMDLEVLRQLAAAAEPVTAE